MSIAAMSSYGSSAWNVQTRAAGSVEEAQPSSQATGTTAVPQGTPQVVDEYVPASTAAEETAATYKPPTTDTKFAVSDSTTESISLDSSSVENAEAVEGSAITVQSSENSTEGEALATAEMAAPPVAAETSEDSSSTAGKPAWISDENWAAIQENPNQQPSGMSDDDWQAYLEWAGKSSPSTNSQEPVQQVVQSEQAAVTEGMPVSAAATIVTTEQAESTTRETTTQSAQESGNRFNEYGNRYSRWNSGNMNVDSGSRLNVTA